MSEISRPKAHLFICTNHRHDGGSCAQKGAEKLREDVKRSLGDPRVRVNKAGCLGHCEQGITAVLYPEGRWFTKLTSESGTVLVDAVKEALE